MAKRSIHDDDLDEDLGDGLDDLGDEGLVGDGFSKQVWAFIIATLVVLGTILGLLVYYNVGEGAVTGVTLTEPSRSDDVFTFAYSIQTDRGLASGEATFLASWEGQSTYSRTFTVNPGGGSLVVKAEDFVWGNGEYTFRLQYGGFEGKSNYTIGIPDKTNFIVTSIRTDTRLYYPPNERTGILLISVNFLSYQATEENDTDIYANSPENTSILVRITKNGVQDGPPIEYRVDGQSYRNFNVTPSLGAGNYTVNVTYTNNWVRPDSSFKTLYHQNRTFIHNKPTACVSQAQYEANPSNGYTVTFDGSCSSDDLGISQFTWSPGFGDPITNGTSPYETVNYSGKLPGLYDCSLEVLDTGIPGVEGSEQPDLVTFKVHVSLT